MNLWNKLNVFNKLFAISLALFLCVLWLAPFFPSKFVFSLFCTGLLALIGTFVGGVASFFHYYDNRP